MKSWFYKLFGVGKLRESLLTELENERIVSSDEGLKSSITYLNFRAPGRYSNWKRRWIAGAFVLTEKRLILQQFSQPVINILLTDERVKKMKISGEADDVLLFSFEPNLFLENSTGQIEWRFRTNQARTIANAILARIK